MEKDKVILRNLKRLNKGMRILNSNLERLMVGVNRVLQSAKQEDQTRERLMAKGLKIEVEEKQQDKQEKQTLRKLWEKHKAETKNYAG